MGLRTSYCTEGRDSSWDASCGDVGVCVGGRNTCGEGDGGHGGWRGSNDMSDCGG